MAPDKKKCYTKKGCKWSNVFLPSQVLYWWFRIKLGGNWQFQECLSSLTNAIASCCGRVTVVIDQKRHKLSIF